MKIVINGQITELQSKISMEELIAHKGLDLKRVVVEYNGEVLPKDVWGQTVLEDGDKVELLSFVGGG